MAGDVAHAGCRSGCKGCDHDDVGIGREILELVEPVLVRRPFHADAEQVPVAEGEEIADPASRRLQDAVRVLGGAGDHQLVQQERPQVEDVERLLGRAHPRGIVQDEILPLVEQMGAESR